MRFVLLLLLSMLAGCAGNVADYVGSRSAIVTPQLARYGLDQAQTQCVGDHLAGALDPLQLRRLVRTAASVTTGYFEADRLTVRDLSHVASQMKDQQVSIEVARATEACGVPAGLIGASEVAGVSAPPVSTAAGAAAAASRPAAWLNLGAAASGQSIAVDASTIEQAAPGRKAWFRLTNPGTATPTGIIYLLAIDCSAKTINPIGQRKQEGETDQYRAYGDDEDGPLPIERGTVMEIAYLAICT